MNSKRFVVLDLGTSDIKCGCVEASGAVVFRHKRRFPLIRNGNTWEIDFEAFREISGNLVRECLTKMASQRTEAEALLVTSQAQTFAPVDADFRPLRRGLVWLDERAAKEAAELDKSLPDFSAAAGFARPAAAQHVSKLLWLKRHEPTIFRAARAFPLLNEFFVYKLTGQFFSDSTNFGMGGVYDLRQNGLNRKVLRILELSESHFPNVVPAATRGELISRQIREQWGLSKRFPVFLCGNDQGASARGAGVRRAGDVALNLGTAMVLYTVTDSLVTALTDAQISGKHPVGDDYFLLNFEPDFGLKMRRLKEVFFPNGTYDDLYRTYFQFNGNEMQKARVDESDWQNLTGTEARRLCAGEIHSFVRKLKAHLERIKKTAPVHRIFLSGGMTRSPLLVKIVTDVLQQPVHLRQQAEAGLMGAVQIFLDQKSKRA